MDNNLTIDTGEIRLTVNDDPSRVIRFNPTDVPFVERFFKLIGEYENKLVEFKRRADELGITDGYIIDEVPSNIEQQAALLREFCEYTQTKIDEIFGSGTSKAAFGNAMNAEMFPQFFEGVTRYIQNVRSDKISKYLTHRPTASKVRSKTKSKKKK